MMIPYFLVLFVLATYGCNRYWLVVRLLQLAVAIFPSHNRKPPPLGRAYRGIFPSFNERTRDRAPRRRRFLPVDYAARCFSRYSKFLDDSNTKIHDETAADGQRVCRPVRAAQAFQSLTSIAAHRGGYKAALFE